MSISLTLSDTPLNTRHFYGLGVECDGVLYNENNRKSKVTEEDYAMLEQRLIDTRPALSRMFWKIPQIFTDLDPDTLNTDSEEYRNNLRMLRVLKKAGALVNAVLFEPFRVEVAQLKKALSCMIRLLQHLHAEEDCTHIRWLTLFNEPDSAFAHESPLMQNLFGQDFTPRHLWSTYVDLHRAAEQQLQDAGLFPHIRLAAVDTVWGAPLRKERITLAAQDMSDLDLTYSYHNYNPEDPSFYETASPDFYYPGMGQEAADFRTIIGDDKDLIIWEFNLAGTHFGGYFPGIDERGCMVTETPDGGVRLAGKIFDAINNGIDGFCLWNMCDMHYYADAYQMGLMRFGLWRYKYEKWSPRPYSFYYAALCQTLRPGTSFHTLEIPSQSVKGCAGILEGKRILGFLNQGETEESVSVSAEASFNAGQNILLSPSLITPTSQYPCTNWSETSPGDILTFTLPPSGMLLWREE